MFAHAGENLCWLELRFRSQAHAFGAPLCGLGLRGAVEPTFIVPLMKFVEYSEAALQPTAPENEILHESRPTIQSTRCKRPARIMSSPVSDFARRPLLLASLTPARIHLKRNRLVERCVHVAVAGCQGGSGSGVLAAGEPSCVTAATSIQNGVM